MGLLGYIQAHLPKPSQDEIEQERRWIAQLQSGSSGYDLLGRSPEELDMLRQQRGIPQAEPPSPWVSIGRGVTDIWDPIKQSYLNATDPAQAQAFRQQRADEEQRYLAGLQWANPQPNYDPQRDDLWRLAGQQTPMLLGAAMSSPLSVPAFVASSGVTQSLYDALNTIRKQLGIGE